MQVHVHDTECNKEWFVITSVTLYICILTIIDIGFTQLSLNCGIISLTTIYLCIINQ